MGLYDDIMGELLSQRQTLSAIADPIMAQSARAHSYRADTGATGSFLDVPPRRTLPRNYTVSTAETWAERVQVVHDLTISSSGSITGAVTSPLVIIVEGTLLVKASGVIDMNGMGGVGANGFTAGGGGGLIDTAPRDNAARGLAPSVYHDFAFSYDDDTTRDSPLPDDLFIQAYFGDGGAGAGAGAGSAGASGNQGTELSHPWHMWLGLFKLSQWQWSNAYGIGGGGGAAPHGSVWTANAAGIGGQWGGGGEKGATGSGGGGGSGLGGGGGSGANAAAGAVTLRGGGDGGGCVLILCRRLANYGTIRANGTAGAAGGAGADAGAGGGGGGGVLVGYEELEATGTLTANGGAGGAAGAGGGGTGGDGGAGFALSFQIPTVLT